MTIWNIHNRYFTFCKFLKRMNREVANKCLFRLIFNLLLTIFISRCPLIILQKKSIVTSEYSNTEKFKSYML